MRSYLRLFSALRITLASALTLACIAMMGCGAVQVSDQPETPFKLATYNHQGERHIGLVFNDTHIMNLTQANLSFQSAANLPAMRLSDDMRSLIDMEEAVWPRLYQIANYAGKYLLTDNPPVYVLPLDRVKLEAPIQYPRKLLCAAANYLAHRQEMQMETANAPKTTPYIFPKMPTVTIIGTGDTIRIPEGRDQIDWEGELAVVIGKHAKNVPAEKAYEYVLGYSIMNDVSDRGGGGNPDFPGPNWFHGKTHDTAAPTGPYIVPKAFISDPMNLHTVLKVNEDVMQDSHTSDMIYNISELIAYASSICTLEPGDTITCGSPPGVGAGVDRRIFLKRGDVITITIDEIGTLVNPVY